MQSLSHILGNKNFDEPPEVAAIKKYVLDNFKSVVSVQVRSNELVISAPSAALIATLRLQAPEMKRRCQIDKRLIFRID